MNTTHGRIGIENWKHAAKAWPRVLVVAIGLWLFVQTVWPVTGLLLDPSARPDHASLWGFGLPQVASLMLCILLAFLVLVLIGARKLTTAAEAAWIGAVIGLIGASAIIGSYLNTTLTLGIVRAVLLATGVTLMAVALFAFGLSPSPPAPRGRR